MEHTLTPGPFRERYRSARNPSEFKITSLRLRRPSSRHATTLGSLTKCGWIASQRHDRILPPREPAGCGPGRELALNGGHQIRVRAQAPQDLRRHPELTA